MMGQHGSRLGRLTRYGTVGVVTNVAAYCIFLVFLWGGMKPVVASGFSYVLAVCASYIANRTWSYQSDASHRHDLLRYGFSYGAGLGVAVGSMAVLTIWIRPEIAQIFLLPGSLLA